MTSPKIKWPIAEAQAVAAELVAALESSCARVTIAGSIRRKRPTVSDVELLYVPRLEAAADPASLFGDTALVNLADGIIAELEKSNILARRRNAKGHETFGPSNKLVVHVASGIPVDLFSATEECWANYLVCRTGGTESNIAICKAAQSRGWSWRPYGAGFMNNGVLVPVRSERDVFELVGLPYMEPELRQ